MTDLTLPPADDTARRIFDEYYHDEPLSVYTDTIPDDFDSLDEVLAADIRDLLHNGGAEDLGLDYDDSHDDAIATALHDDFEYLTAVSLSLATLMTNKDA